MAQGLAGRRLLLVLDTCEHVIDVAVSMAEAVLGAGLYGALVVKGNISLDHSRVVGRPPATPQGRVRRWSVACRRALSFRDSAADYPANHGIPLAGGPRWRLRRPSVPAVEQGAGLVPRVKRDAAGAAGCGGGLAAPLSSSGSADAGSGHSEFLLSIVTVTFAEMTRGRHWGAEYRAYSLVFGGMEETGP